jgi:CubicO group peptidase (beta-lactamase class C family)
MTFPTSPDYADAIRRLNETVRQQMAAHNVGGVAIAIVDDQRLVQTAGFGTARPDSIFRAGSISKVINALAIMQLVEQGKLDLDAPITSYGREFSLIVPFDDAPPVTLRQLLCHRSGISRESPVGGYLDASSPSLADTVAAIRDCPLITRPNTDTRYSNIGPSIAGRILTTVTGVPYHEYLREHVFGPLGMTSTVFRTADIPPGRLVPSTMRIADGHGGFVRGAAPQFDIGEYPAGNVFTTAEDLAKFISMLAAGGRASGGRIISKETLAEMATPQLVPIGGFFGIGFRIGKFRRHKWFGHTGSVYGYTSSFVFLPGPKLGVVVLGNEDIVTGPIDKLIQRALGLMIEAKLGEKMPPEPKPAQFALHDLLPLVGEYESACHWAKIEIVQGRLAGNISSQPIALTPVAVSPGSVATATTFLADGRLLNSAPVKFTHDAAGNPLGFTAMAQKFSRVDVNAVPEVPPLWSQYVGVYGSPFIPLVISIRHGHLYALIENELDYRLTPSSRHVFVCPAGMYRDEQLVFLTDAKDNVHGVCIANQYLPRQK